MASQTRDPTSFDASSGTWDATTVGTINDYPDSSSTYLTHGTTAGNGTWNISAPTVPSTAFNIVVKVYHYRYKSGGTCNTAGRIKIGASYYNGTPTNLTNNVTEQHTETWSNNPATGTAWTYTTANSIAAIGIYSTDANPQIRVYSVRLEVTYDLPVTINLAAASLTATGQAAAISAPLPPLTINLAVASLTATGQAAAISAPISINLTAGALAATGQILTVIAPASGPATIALATAALLANGQALTVVLPQSARPISDITKGGWTASSGTDLYAMLDESYPSDADYIRSASNPTADLCEVRLATLNDPLVGTGHKVKYRVDREGDATTQIVFYLMEGATQRATWTVVNAPGDPTDGEYALSEAEANAISDYSNLRVRIEATVG